MAGITIWELWLIKSIAKTVSLFCTIDFEWDEKSKLLKPVVPTKFKKITNAMWIFLTCCLIPHVIWRLYKLYILRSESFSNPLLDIINITITIVYALIIVGVHEFWKYRNDLAHLLNQLLQFDRTIAKTDFFARTYKQQSKDIHKREMYFLGIAFAFFTIIHGGALVIIIFEVYYLWTFNNSTCLTGIVIVVVPFVHDCGVFILMFLGVQLFLYFAAIKSALSTLVNTKEIKQFNYIATTYKSLFIICTTFNCFLFKRLIPIIKYSLCILSMLCLLAAVQLRHRGKLFPNNPFLSVITPIGFIMLACNTYAVVILTGNASSYFWEMSKEFLWKFQHDGCLCEKTKRGLYLRLVGKSLLPLRFSFGGIYFMDKQAKCTLISFVIELTANLLIAFK